DVCTFQCSIPWVSSCQKKLWVFHSDNATASVSYFSFAKFLGILNCSIDSIKSVFDQFDCHTIFFWHIERQFNSKTVSLFVAKFWIIFFVPEQYNGSISQIPCFFMGLLYQDASYSFVLVFREHGNRGKGQ